MLMRVFISPACGHCCPQLPSAVLPLLIRPRYAWRWCGSQALLALVLSDSGTCDLGTIRSCGWMAGYKRRTVVLAFCVCSVEIILCCVLCVSRWGRCGGRQQPGCSLLLASRQLLRGFKVQACQDSYGLQMLLAATDWSLCFNSCT
jgi:hypothetical protein